MGDVCQTLFRRKPRKFPHWDPGDPGEPGISSSPGSPGSPGIPGSFAVADTKPVPAVNFCARAANCRLKPSPPQILRYIFFTIPLCLCARHRLVQYANADFYKKLFCAVGHFPILHQLGYINCLTRLPIGHTGVKHFFDENRENRPIGSMFPLKWEIVPVFPLK